MRAEREGQGLNQHKTRLNVIYNRYAEIDYCYVFGFPYLPGQHLSKYQACQGLKNA